MTTLSSDPGAASPDPRGSSSDADDELDELGAPLPAPGGTPKVGRRPRRRRLALWISLAAGAVVAVLIAVLAAAGPSSEQLTQSPLLGKPAPELHGRALLNGPAGGGPVNLSSYRGKWVLVNFAASWCVPCQEEMPQLLLFAKQHQASGNAAIVTVQFDPSDGANLTHFLKVRSVGWTAVDDPNAPVDWGVGALPDSYVVDPEGTVIAEVEGQANAADLDALVKKYSPGASGS
jgi:cytochrome c biogenesis protein CcmG, thiol:disulfide interchange protein DsbE